MQMVEIGCVFGMLTPFALKIGKILTTVTRLLLQRLQLFNEKMAGEVPILSGTEPPLTSPIKALNDIKDTLNVVEKGRRTDPFY